MSPGPSQAKSGSQLAEANHRVYDPQWVDADVVEPERSNTFPSS